MPCLGYQQTSEHVEKCRVAKIGKRHTIERKRNIQKGLPVGVHHKHWKGGEASYKAIHQWVQRWYGKPKECDECGRKELTGRKIHWANRSGRYFRNRLDWRRLCQPCHSKFDQVGVKGIDRARRWAA